MRFQGMLHLRGCLSAFVELVTFNHLVREFEQKLEFEVPTNITASRWSPIVLLGNVALVVTIASLTHHVNELCVRHFSKIFYCSYHFRYFVSKLEINFVIRKQICGTFRTFN
jgi:hypothetical protein